MVVSEEKKYCFIHVPKVGGTSIQHALLNADPSSTKHYWAKGNIDNSTKHIKASELQTGLARGKWWTQRLFSSERSIPALNAIYVRGKWWGRRLIRREPQFEDFFRFSFVRNPWDRVVSLYSYYERRYREEGTVQEVKEGMRNVDSFRDFVDQLVHRASWMQGLYGPRPQKAFLENEDGEVALEFVGRFENLSEDFSKVCDIIDVDAELPHKNASTHAKYAAYYDPDLVDKVGAFYDEDVSYFGYRFSQ